ncbi:hypothetical protein, partial [Vibrio sagamiensis]|uniref:hypothetical protein n=2 Tax=Vibrio sagamiensis TaxID=512650 RepID=UPI000587C272
MITAVNSNQNLNIDNKSSSDAPKRKNGEVASNIKAYAGNMQGVLDTLKNNGVKINNEQSYLSINRFVVNEHDLAGLEDITTPHQDTVFTDLYSKEETLMDKGRFLALAKEIMDAKGEKSIDFDLKGVNAGKLKTKPLEPKDYSKGAPFMLSCKTKHCDFPGAVGGNYPTAEYLSDKGSSVKIFNSAEEYVGHYNIWKQEDGDFCIGTIAMIDNHGTSKYSPKDLKNLVAAQAISLLENNPQANSVSIGMGGHNLKNMFPGKFDKNTDGYKALGSLRHADLSTASQGLVKELKELENITSYKVRTDSPVIANQKEIGMMPDQRKDFKNALVVVDKGNLNQQKRVLENFEQTKNQSSSRARTQHENGVSQKLQRAEAYQSNERRT